jgi:DNA-binding transcriptional ArsR family regulator
MTMALATEDDRLSETFAALTSATRRAMLDRLAEGPATVNELAEPFSLTLPAVSKHIKVLEQAGLVVRGRQAQFRPCALDASALREVATWAERYRPVWEARLDRMADHLAQLQHTTGRQPR